MTAVYQHLGAFSDWVTAANKAHPLYPVAPAGADTRQRIRDVLAFSLGAEEPQAVRTERQWDRDDLIGEEVSWSVGYGPRTYAWVLKPKTLKAPSPGVVALHDHGHFKFYGKEKIAEGADEVAPVLMAFRRTYYGARAFANALAREGFVVLVPDTFLWGSRRFPLETMPDIERRMAELIKPLWSDDSTPAEIGLYNAAAVLHEHLIEKYCIQLGTTLAAVMSYEDRVALNYLASRGDVVADRIGCIGLSGGGCRAALMQATCDRVSAAVIIGMMSTYEHLLDHNIAPHTWMFFPAGWSRHGDWADLAACRAPSPLLVQYDLDDDLFTAEGMQAAHDRISAHYRQASAAQNYVGEFYAGPHRFDVAMQDSAFCWLKRRLSEAPESS
jgi:dienelactone hydrolase